MSKTKNPWAAAVLNFILPGLGYIYTKKKRIIFSVSLFILSIIVAIHDWDEITAILYGRMSLTVHFMLFIILYPLVFAWDAYKDAKEK